MTHSPSEISRWRVPGLVALVLLIASILPSPLPRHESWETVGPDKFLHFLGHGGFTLSLTDALVASRLDPRTASVLAIGLSTGYSVLLGKLQDHVPGRMDETADTAAAALGSIAGVALWRYLRARDRDR